MTVEEQLKVALTENEKLRRVISSQAETIKEQGNKIMDMENELAWLRKKVFGKMSEKNLPIDPAQLSLFDEYAMTDEERKQLAAEVEAAEKTLVKTITVRQKPVRRPLDTTGLPVEEAHIYPDNTLDESGVLKAEYVEIGTEESSRLERIPAKTYICKTIRHKVILRAEVESKFPEDRTILIAPLSLAPVDKCMAGASVLADIIIGKFMYHLLFYRLMQQYKESGITISDSTMDGWYELTVDKLQALYNKLRQHILSSEYVQIDESVVPVIDNEKHKARKGYEWCVRDGITGDVMFYYDRGSRGHQVARELLGGYRGCAQSDGYDAYDQFEKMEGITMFCCWAHARRKFVDALKEDERHATEAIVYIRKLYAVEAEADEKGIGPEDRKEWRLKISYPTIQVFEKWMKETYVKVLPKSKIGEAIAYTYSLLPRLSRYVNDGRINIDNNLIENAIRPLALGRKNWLFCGNDASAYRAAIVYSLIGSCKAAGVDPRTWMEDVLRKLPYYNRDGKDIAELLPRAWAESQPTRD
ncbi:MAG: IS66 family transposase [Muribaculaceae bacterium]|nr:IS66 family transposase [Muribaculaceae bacterium]